MMCDISSGDVQRLHAVYRAIHAKVQSNHACAPRSVFISMKRARFSTFGSEMLRDKRLCA